jgi:hypothetical protein
VSALLNQKAKKKKIFKARAYGSDDLLSFYTTWQAGDSSVPLSHAVPQHAFRSGVFSRETKSSFDSKSFPLQQRFLFVLG